MTALAILRRARTSAAVTTAALIVCGALLIMTGVLAHTVDHLSSVVVVDGRFGTAVGLLILGFEVWADQGGDATRLPRRTFSS